MMKVTRAAKKEARPREILEAAFEEFLIHGYSATRLEDIASRVGITKGNIYGYYQNKEALFSSMVSELSQPKIEKTKYQTALGSASALAVLEQFTQEMYRSSVEDRYSRQIIRLLISSSDTFNELLQKYLDDYVECSFEILAMILDRGCATGEFRPTAKEFAPQFLFSPLLGLTIMKSIHPNHGPETDAFLTMHFSMLTQLLLA